MFAGLMPALDDTGLHVTYKIIPLFIRNSEAMGDIYMGKWPMTTLSFITDTT